jgi:phosphosulfolactate phosphohydrolase-like enzyme
MGQIIAKFVQSAIDDAVADALAQEHQQTKNAIDDAVAAALAHERHQTKNAIDDAVAAALAHERQQTKKGIDKAVTGHRVAIENNKKLQKEVEYLQDVNTTLRYDVLAIVYLREREHFDRCVSKC